MTRLRQILLNLLANAVKFTERGEVVLTVSAAGTRRRETELTFAVRDTGIGLSAEAIGRAVPEVQRRPTRRRRASTAARASGLAISKRLAELMGGTMWVESGGPGRGRDVHRSRSTRRPPQLPAQARREFIGAQPRARRAGACWSSTTTPPTVAC